MRLSMFVLLLPLLMQQDGSGIVAMWCQIPLRKPLPKALQEGGLNLLGYRCKCLRESAPAAATLARNCFPVDRAPAATEPTLVRKPAGDVQSFPASEPAMGKHSDGWRPASPTGCQAVV